MSALSLWKVGAPVPRKQIYDEDVVVPRGRVKIDE
jgi:hypothetical protein